MGGARGLPRQCGEVSLYQTAAHYSEGVQRSGCYAGGLGAVFRTVLETMRTLFVWLVDLLLFYTPLGLGKLGESWSNWSFLQAAG